MMETREIIKERRLELRLTMKEVADHDRKYKKSIDTILMSCYYNGVKGKSLRQTQSTDKKRIR